MTANPQFLAGEGKRRVWKSREVAGFLKDDFKVSPNLTLNIGLRYEYYGVPFDPHGKTAALVGGSQGIFGISGADFGAVFQPTANSGSLRVHLVAQGSANPGTLLFNPDRNNFAPAVGFAWNLPKTGLLGDRNPDRRSSSASMPTPSTTTEELQEWRWRRSQGIWARWSAPATA